MDRGSEADKPAMAELVEKRWKRYGKDRVYVSTAEGVSVGHVDLQQRSITVADPQFENALLECLERWCPSGNATDDQGDPPGLDHQVAEMSPWAAPTTPTGSRIDETPGRNEPANGPSQPVDPPAPPTEAPAPAGLSSSETNDAKTAVDSSGTLADAPRDLIANLAGEAARGKRNEVNAEAPVRNLVARVLGVKTEERSWRVGARGEEKVAIQLAKLGEGWHRIHAVPVGDNGSDIDHVVIGPPGVFTLNAKRHPGGKAWIGERTVMVNGHKTAYLHNARFEARRASKLLSDACGAPITVAPVIVFVDLDTFTVKQTPPDVHVTTRLRLLRWLRSLPPTLDADTVESIFAVARLSTTWQPPRS